MFRNDAYGECELYGGHLAQVYFYLGFVIILLIKDWLSSHNCLKINQFQIDSLPENFCLLDYAHTAVRNKKRKIFTASLLEPLSIHKTLNFDKQLSNLQGLPADWYWHSSNDIESEGFSYQKIIPP